MEKAEWKQLPRDSKHHSSVWGVQQVEYELVKTADAAVSTIKPDAYSLAALHFSVNF